MKKIVPVILAIALFASLGSVAIAAKPQDNGAGKDVITLSNGFPSGAHYNLNIHGKNDSYTCIPYDETADSHNVVNMPEYGSGTITYVSGRKVKIDELIVFDACTETFDGDPAEVWLPSEAEGYYVFARALGKPGNGIGGDVSSIIIENGDLTAYTPIIGDISSPDDLLEIELPLGLITNGGDYKINSTTEAGIELIRFDSEPVGKGKGKTLGKDITDMFMFYGFVFQPILDLNGDESVNELDVEYCCWSDYDINDDGIIDIDDLIAIGDVNLDGTIDRLDLAFIAPCTYDLNNNGVIEPWDGSLTDAIDEFETWLNDNKEGYVFPLSLDLNVDGVVDYADVPASYDINGTPGIQQDEFEAWLSDELAPATIDDYWVALWAYYDEDNPIWVFNIADLVYQNQVFTNDGIKNLQIRFYPVDTTIFNPAP